MKKNLESVLELLNYQVVMNEGNVVLINMVNGNIMPAKMRKDGCCLYSLGSKLVIVWHDDEVTAIDIINDDKTINFCYEDGYLNLSCESSSDNGDYLARLSLNNETIQADLKANNYDTYVGYTDGKLASDLEKTNLEYVGFNGKNYDTIFLEAFGKDAFLMRNSLEDTEITTSKWAVNYGRSFILTMILGIILERCSKSLKEKFQGLRICLLKSLS